MHRLTWRSAWISVRPDRRARYKVTWYDADRRQRSLSYPTRALAVAALRRIEAEINRELTHDVHRPEPPAADKSWMAAVAEYGTRLATMSAKHQDEVLRTLEYYTLIVRPQSIRTITPAMCEHYFAQRAVGEPRERPAPHGERRRQLAIPSPATLRKEYIALAAFFALFVDRGDLDRHPMRSVKKPRLGRRIPRQPRAEEWVEVLQSLQIGDLRIDDPQAWHVLILLAVATKLRQGDLLRITRGDIELGGADRHGVAILRMRAGKTDNERIYGLPPIISDRVAQRLKHLPAGADAKLFPWRVYPRKAFDRLRNQKGLAWTFGSLRGAGGTRVAVEQAVRAAQGALDHSSPAVTTRHYLSLVEIEVAAALHTTLPELPPLPAYRAPHTRGAERRPGSG